MISVDTPLASTQNRVLENKPGGEDRLPENEPHTRIAEISIDGIPMP